MPKNCDNTSVGVIIERGGDIALLKRAKFPVGMAPPAGHIDEHGSPLLAGINEVREELGLVIEPYSLIRTAITARRVENRCRRAGGDHHLWWVYEAQHSEGELDPSNDETQGAAWYPSEMVQSLVDRTRDRQLGRIAARDWNENPGLEQVWLDFFVELGYAK